jgi:hypothetical protein
MTVQLSYKWRLHLLDMPESGMNYHRVDVLYTDGSSDKDCVVTNTEDLEVPLSALGKTIKDITLHV